MAIKAVGCIEVCMAIRTVGCIAIRTVGCIGVWNAREASRIVDGSVQMFVDGVDDFGSGRHVGAASRKTLRCN